MRPWGGGPCGLAASERLEGFPLWPVSSLEGPCASGHCCFALPWRFAHKKTPVPYPSILKSKGIGGVVKLKVFIKPDGTVRDTAVLGGNPILAESAQKSVMQWKFSTASSETVLELSVSFDPHAESGS